MKRLLLLLSFSFLSLSMMAERIEYSMALNIAKTILPESQLTNLSSKANYNNMYIFSGENSFVIIAADDRATPVLGYSQEYPFVIENLPKNINRWLTSINDEIQYAIDNNIIASEETRSDWEHLKKGIKPEPKSRANVEPLVKTHWNQGEPYNNMCPGGSVTGCAATAMAQVMKYWEWPRKGEGSHSYHEDNYGTLSANFANTTYDWDNMIDQPTASSTQAQKNAVATLMYHCGVSIEMDYSPEVSGAYPSDVLSALDTYFDYSSNMESLFKSYYTNTEWINILKHELNASRPILYSGWDINGGGHSFICDGYDNNNNFHFNWGWGGYCDGYYAIGALSPGSGGTGSGSGIYNEDNFIIIGVEPNTPSINPPGIVITNVDGDDVTISWCEPTITWDFEGSADGWTTINANNDNHTWYHSSEAANHGLQGTSESHSGTGLMMSESFCNGSGIAMTPDDYLVSPQKIAVVNGTTLSFYACSQDANYSAEHFGVAVSTGSNTSASSFTTISEWTIGAKNNNGNYTRDSRAATAWIRYDVDLSSYAGNDVWVAIRHFNCNDQFILLVDDICISEIASTKDAHHYKVYRDGFVINNNVTGTSFTDQNLTFGTYHYQVRSVLSNGDYSVMSAPVEAVISYEGPVPTNLTATQQGANSVKLTWNAPSSQSTTLKYGDGQAASAMGYGEVRDFYWGQRYTVAQLSDYAGMAITSVQVYVSYSGSYTLLVYKETEDGNLQQIHSKTFSHSGGSTWKTINLNSPLVIDYTNNLIIALHTSTIEYPAVYTNYAAGDPNASLYSADGTSFPYYSEDISWLIKTNISDGTFTYNVYRDGNQIVSNITQKNYTDQNLNYGTYEYTVRTNYHGGLSNPSEPVSITVTEPEEYNVTLSVNPDNAGSVTGAGSYYEGTSVTVTATPNTGYIFQKWTENGSQVSTNTSYTFNISDNRNLVANFIIGDLTLDINDINEPSCNGGNNGSVTVDADGGIPPYIYTLDGQSSGETNGTYTFENLSAGNYSIEVNDASGLHTTTTVEIGEPNGLTTGMIESESEELCEGEQAGTIGNEQEATSDQGGLTYRWKKNGEVISNSNSAQYTPSSLSAGSYTFTREVKDNCEDWTSSEGEKVIVVHETPNVTINGNTEIIVGESTTLTASGADIYVWSTGETTASITVSPTENTEYSVVGTIGGICTDEASIIVHTTIPDAIEETNNNTIRIYPNPVGTNTEINLVTICNRIEIFNTIGTKVAEYENTDHIDGIENAGVYIIRITSKGVTLYERIIVK